MTSALASLPTIAVDAISHMLRTGRRRLPAPAELPPALARPGAAFVTLERGEALLGCIGTLTADTALGTSVAHSAIAAAFDDPRMPAVDPDDFPVMRVKVSVLSDPQPLAVASRAALVAALEPGTTGVIVERVDQRGDVPPRGLGQAARSGRLPRRAVGEGRAARGCGMLACAWPSTAQSNSSIPARGRAWK